MDFRTIILALSFPVLLSIGQILFKKGAVALEGTHQPFWLALLTSFPIILAVVLYALSTVLWIWLLQHTKLTVLYPISALSYFFVPVLAYFFLGEALSWPLVFGTLLIMMGIMVITLEVSC